MTQCRRSPFIASALILFAGLLISTFVPAKIARAAFDPNNLIRDDLFVDSNAMDEASIQGYLEAYGSCLATVSPSLLDSDVRASALINNASKQFGISPKVLLVTMQKEQSLITKSCAQLDAAQGMQYALNGALGYNMPDTLGVGTCLYTFKRQLFGANCNGSDYWGSPRSFRNNWDLGRGPGGTTFPQSFVVQEKSWIPGVNITVNPQTKATGLLYRYTPYAYNGNYNFWNLYHNVFFPPVAYASEYVWQSAMSTQVLQGQSTEVAISIKNKGYITWNTTGTNAVKLATNNPLNRTSLFSATWPAVNRVHSCNVERGDSAQSVNPLYVKPGQIAVFCVTFSAPSNMLGGTYREEFSPILEGIPNTIEINGIGVDVLVGQTHNAAWIDQSANTPIESTQFATRWIKYRNIGTSTWRKTGDNPVRLATARTLNHSSNFVTDSWVSPSRPGIAGSNASFTLVEAGSNPNVSQDEVKPGQIATFPFDLKAHAWIGLGTFNEYVTLSQDGAGGYGQFGPDDAYFVHNIVPYWQSEVFGSIQDQLVGSGSYISVTIKLRNIGTTTWSSTGSNKVVLATARPSGRGSDFVADSWIAANKVLSFSSTEAGSDPDITAGQVKPGQIGVFTFPMKAHAWMGLGTYLEYFTLRQEGAGGGDFNTNNIPVNITIAPRFSAAWHAQTVLPPLPQGSTGTVTIKYRNTGGDTWFNSGQNPVRLATARPFGRYSPFIVDGVWSSGNRIATFSSTEAGSNPDITAGQVKPGQIGVFTFPMKAHAWMGLGTFNEYVTLSQDGSGGYGQFGPDDAYVQVRIVPALYAAWESQSDHPDIVTGGVSSVTIKLRNIGTTTWSSTGSNKVVLATARPSGRGSDFVADSWIAANKVLSFSSTEAGSDPDITAGQVKPGQIGVFTFPMKAHAWMGLGTYLEYFTLRQEGAGGYGQFGPDDMYVRPRIISRFSAAWHAQTVLQPLPQGSTGTVTIKYRNTGGDTWFNSGQNPVRLATARPFGRYSPFIVDGVWSSGNRIATFSSTEAGSNPDITAGQVKPGQIGVFTFPMKAHAWMGLGTFNEYVTLSQDGSGGYGQFGPDDAYVQVRIVP